MTETPPSELPKAESLRPTVVQFNLRQLLVLTLAACPLFALASPWLYDDDYPQWQRIALGFSVVMIQWGVFAWWLCRVRRRAKSRAGEPRLKLCPKSDRWVRHTWYWFFGGPWTLTLFAFPFNMPEQYETSRIWGMIIMLPVQAFVSAATTLLYWWRTPFSGIEMGEQGIINFGLFFYPWDKLESWTWDNQSKKSFRLFSQHFDGGALEVSVAPELVDQVERILTEHLPREDERPAMVMKENHT